MNRVLLIVGGVLVGLLAALFVVPVFIDWTRYRGVLEEEATKLLGREIRVGGKVNLRLLPTPYIRLEKVRIADTLATIGEPLFRAEDLTVWLAISPLFRGNLEATEIELRKPQLTLVLDGQGGGNWSSLADRPERAVFVPNQVSLGHVRVNDGSIAVLDAAGNEKGRVDHINGEVSAAALEGPYRTSLAFMMHGAAREVRLSTARMEADGSVRLKGTVRSPASGASYTVDGQVQDLLRKPVLTGELTAKLPLPASDDSAKASADASFEMKGTVTANTAGAKVSDIALSFEQDGRPQLAVGEAQIDWQPKLNANVALSSRWLDLDRILGAGAATSVPELVQRAANRLGGQLPAGTPATAKISLEQATLGGDIVSGLTLVVERKDTGLHLQAAAGLPGNSKLQASGLLDATSTSAVFNGDLILRGANSTRFATWAGRHLSLPEIGRDGPFQVAGRFAFGPERVAGSNLVVQLAGSSITGDAAVALTGPARDIALSLEGAELDLTPLMGGKSGAAAAVQALREKVLAGGPAAAGAAALPNANIRLRIGRVLAGNAAFRDVTADFKVQNGNLSIPLLKSGSDDGWSLELQGDVAGLSQPGAKGSLAYNVSADTPEGLAELLKLLDQGDAWLPDRRRAEGLMPLRLAGRVRVGETAPDAYDISADGLLGGQRGSATARIETAGAGWREWRTNLAVTLEGPDARRLFDAVAPEGLLGTGGASAAISGPARMSVRAIGSAKSGLVSLASLESKGLSAEYRGRLTIDDVARPDIDGQLRLTVPDLAALAAATLGRERPSLRDKPLQGVVAIAGLPGRLRLSSDRLQLGGTVVSAKLEQQPEAGQPSSVLKGAITASEVSLPALLDALTIAAPGSAMDRDGKSASAWNEGAFEFGALSGWRLQLTVNTPRFELLPDVAIGKSALQLAAKDGRLELTLTDGQALGGKAVGAVNLERAPSGARARGTLAVTGAKAEAFAASAAKPAVTGQLAFKADLESQALSPRGLVAALRGTGEVSVTQAKLNQFSPRAIKDAADAILSLKGEIPAGELKRRLEQALSAGAAPIGQRAIPVVIADGVARLAPMSVEVPDGRVSGNTVMDLEALRIDSEWRIDPAPAIAASSTKRADGTARRQLPGISVVYVGPLASLGAIEPKLQFEDLEREVTVRKMERDLEDLERVRRQDEDRARLERETPAEAPAPVPIPVPQPQRSESPQPGVAPGSRSDAVSPGAPANEATQAGQLPRAPSAATIIPLPGAIPAAEPNAADTPAAQEPTDLPGIVKPQTTTQRPASQIGPPPQPRPANRPVRDIFRELGRSGN